MLLLFLFLASWKLHRNHTISLIQIGDGFPLTALNMNCKFFNYIIRISMNEHAVRQEEILFLSEEGNEQTN